RHSAVELQSLAVEQKQRDAGAVGGVVETLPDFVVVRVEADLGRGEGGDLATAAVVAVDGGGKVVAGEGEKGFGIAGLALEAGGGGDARQWHRAAGSAIEREAAHLGFRIH